MPKRPNPMAINKVLTYTTEEAARALQVTTATIRNYVRRGLPVMKGQRPYLYHGEELREFLIQDRQRTKRPLKTDELFCPACKKGKRPFGLMVDLVPRNAKTAMLKGLCDACEGPTTGSLDCANYPISPQSSTSRNGVSAKPNRCRSPQP